MNKILIQNINKFIKNISEYIKMEYDSIYYVKLIQHHSELFDFIGSYYMGGSNIPDTSRYVVDFIKKYYG